MNRRIISLLVIISILFSSFMCGCDISSKHLEKHYDENDNDNIQGWDDVEDNYDDNHVQSWDDSEISIQTWSEVEDYTDWVYAEILFENISTEMPIIDCQVLDYRSNGDYFDGELVYELVNDQFDVNTFVTQYAVGTGVIVICVILNVATAGGTTPICCFIAGAADGAISGAVKGAAFGSAINAVISYIRTGDFEDTMYGALEGSAQGYMWGAIFGAVSGGWNSRYCFVEGTPVITDTGAICIEDLQLGDLVYAYDEISNDYTLSEVTQIITNQTTETVLLNVGDSQIECTPNHMFLSRNGWVQASELVSGDELLITNNEYATINSIENITYSAPIDTYNICVADYHTYMVGEDGLVTHNACNVNKYKDQTILFDDAENFPEFVNPELAAKYPNGVYINPQGYPDFSPYALANEFADGAPTILEFAELNPNNVLQSTRGLSAEELLSRCLSGDEGLDLRAADKIMQELYPGWTHPQGYTWHHSDDCRSLILVPSDLHSVSAGGLPHNGGASIIRSLLSSI